MIIIFHDNTDVTTLLIKKNAALVSIEAYRPQTFEPVFFFFTKTKTIHIKLYFFVIWNKSEIKYNINIR